MSDVGPISEEMDNRLSPILNALEKLRQQGNDEVSVPGVVVTGAQSAGKSSVLEALGGIKLPRGQNITTRVPLVLSLHNVPGASPHALIGREPDPDKEIEISSVDEEINSLTTELAGDGFGVSNSAIYLKIVRDSGPTLTLIDLPGITHNSADGSDIHAETVALVKEYIKNKNMVILVVIPAVDDFSNAEAVKLAKEYDPDGSRTLGVVTKVDHVHEGCGIKAKLRMDEGHVQLELGFIAVVNRTPKEVENDTPAEEVRAREQEFFSTNPEVAGLEKEFWGLDTLVERIVELQLERVHEFVPGFISSSKMRIKELKSDLSKMSTPFTSDTQRRDAFHIVVSALSQGLKELVVSGSADIICDSGGPKMNIVPHVTRMYRKYAANIRQEVIPDFFTDEYFRKATAAIKSVDGMALPNQLAGRVCEPLIREVFADELIPRSEQLVEEVRVYIQQVMIELCDGICLAYPSLCSEIKNNLVEQFLDIKESKAKALVGAVCEAEMGWVFTQDPGFEEMLQLVKDKVTSMRENAVGLRIAAQQGKQHHSVAVEAEAVGRIPKAFIEKIARCQALSDVDTVHELQVTLFAYVMVVARGVFDSVPKHVQKFLVNGSWEGFEKWMLTKVSSEDLEAWLEEGPTPRRKRNEAERKLAQFEEGINILRAARFSR